MLTAGCAGVKGMHTGQRGQTLCCRLGSGSKEGKRQNSGLCLGHGIINRDFTYNPKDLAARKFEAKGSDVLEMMVAHRMGFPFLGCPLLLQHTADAN